MPVGIEVMRQLRHAPGIAFHWDPGPENLDHISKILDDLKKGDGA